MGKQITTELENENTWEKMCQSLSISQHSIFWKQTFNDVRLHKILIWFCFYLNNFFVIFVFECWINGARKNESPWEVVRTVVEFDSRFPKYFSLWRFQSDTCPALKYDFCKNKYLWRIYHSGISVGEWFGFDNKKTILKYLFHLKPRTKIIIYLCIVFEKNKQNWQTLSQQNEKRSKQNQRSCQTPTSFTKMMRKAGNQIRSGNQICPFNQKKSKRSPQADVLEQKFQQGVWVSLNLCQKRS